ncbi:hypothetical protein GCM10023075_79200 [Streptosporangium album]
MVGTATLADIVAEAKANKKAFNTRVRTRLRGPYSRRYRRGLPKLPRALAFRCNNTAFQPVMDALKLLDRYADSEAVFYERTETVPTVTDPAVLLRRRLLLCLYGLGTNVGIKGTSCASDSRKFGSWSANFMTEWRQSYHGPGSWCTGTSSAGRCASTAR